MGAENESQDAAKQILFWVLQGLVGLVSTLGCALTVWLVSQAHNTDVRIAEVQKDIGSVNASVERIIAFNQTQQAKVDDLEVRVKVLETYHTRSASVSAVRRSLLKYAVYAP